MHSFPPLQKQNPEHYSLLDSLSQAFSLPSEKELNELGKTKTAEIRQFLI
jgi:hypothetical protein